MRLTNVTKRVLSLAVAATLVATAVSVPVAPKKAEAAKKYTAYLCFASKSYNGVASNHNDSNRKLGVYNGGKKTKISGVKLKNASFKKGKFTFTVSATGKNLKKFAKDKGWNSIYVDTSLPGKDKKKLSVSKVTLKIDGKTVKTIKKPALTPDPGKSDSFTQIMVLNTWNTYAQKKCKATSITKMPKKSISVTVSGKLK
ncbi:MAG: hypothetical protein J1E62_07920 [Lachnospiraceae bacterium]|nr:hypothetical protein [Lachnospiraceae bacterium]